MDQAAFRHELERLLVLVCLLLALSLPTNAADRSFAGILHLQTFYAGPSKTNVFEGFSQIYWIDPNDRCMYRYAASSDPAALLWPLNIPLAPPHAREYKRGKVTKFECTNTLSDFSIDPEHNHTIVALDIASRQVLQLSPGDKHHQWRIVVPSERLLTPTALVVRNKVIYVFDAFAKNVLVLKDGALLQEVAVDPPFPDRVLAGQGELVGINYAAKSLTRFLLNDQGNVRGEIVAVETRVLSVLRRPVDMAVMQSVYYVLDAERHQMVAWSPTLSDPAVMSYAAFANEPTALASDGSRLVFADNANGKFRLLEGVEPVDFLFDGAHPSEALTTLYEYLSNLRLLPMKSHAVRAGETLEALTRSEGTLPAGFTDRFVPVFCKLNPSVACGKKPWQLALSSSVYLPDLPLQTFVGKRFVDLDEMRVSLRRPITLRDAMEPVPPGLRETELDAKLREFNSFALLQSPTSQSTGQFIVPTLIVRTTAMVSTNIHHANHDLNDKLKGEARIFRYSSALGGHESQGKSTKSNHSSDSPTLPPPYFSPIHYHRPQGMSSVTVVIVDSQFNVKHPEFVTPTGGSRLSPYIVPNANGEEPHLQVVSSAQTGKLSPLDHGMHTAALIAGSKVGVNPTAEVKYVSFAHFPSAVSAGEYKIFNLSLGEPDYSTKASTQGGYSDLLANWRDQILDPSNVNLLFVIAAGNANVEIKPWMLASAGSASNVIVAAAADDSVPPRPWLESDGHGSNKGIGYVHVYAPGRNLESATFNSSYAYGSGTSQAAAIVSGMASVLLAEHSEWKPWQVKQRIIATSDLEPWASTDESVGGLIDADLALADSSKDHLMFREGERLIDCTGTIEEHADKQALSVNLSGQDTIQILLKDLKRLHRNKQEQFTIIYQRRNPMLNKNKDSTWEMIRLPEAVARNQLVGFSSIPWHSDGANGCAGQTSADLTQVEDFVARMR